MGAYLLSVDLFTLSYVMFTDVSVHECVNHEEGLHLENMVEHVLLDPQNSARTMGILAVLGLWP